MTRYGFVINLNTCADLRGCMVACMSAEKSFPGGYPIETKTAMSSNYPNPNTYFIPVVCRQCERPACAIACPHGVLTKVEGGIVIAGDTSQCKACETKDCVKACPIGAINVDSITGKVAKCDMCVDRLSQGLPPACMASCLTRSIIFGDLDDPESPVGQIINNPEMQPALHQLTDGDCGASSVYYILSRKEWQDSDTLYSPAWHEDQQ